METMAMSSPTGPEGSPAGPECGRGAGTSGRVSGPAPGTCRAAAARAVTVGWSNTAEASGVRPVSSASPAPRVTNCRDPNPSSAIGRSGSTVPGSTPAASATAATSHSRTSSTVVGTGWSDGCGRSFSGVFGTGVLGNSGAGRAGSVTGGRPAVTAPPPRGLGREGRGGPRGAGRPAGAPDRVSPGGRRVGPGQGPVEVGRAAGVALDLPAGRLGDGARPDQDDGVDRQSVGVAEGAGATSVSFAASPAVSGDVSATRTARSPSAPASTANAAVQPGRRAGWAVSAVSSRSCG